MAPIVIRTRHWWWVSLEVWWVSFACLISLFFFFFLFFLFFGFETLRLCFVFVWCEDERKYEKVLGFVVVCELFGFLES